jgi:Flp pilus assembly protein TadG
MPGLSRAAAAALVNTHLTRRGVLLQSGETIQQSVPVKTGTVGFGWIVADHSLKGSSMRSPMVLISAIRRALRRFSRNRRASTAVEFALIAPMFLALIFAILETALMFFAGQILEIGTQDTARLIFTNQAQGVLSQSQFHDALCTHVSALMSCSNLYVDVKAYPPNTLIPAADLADPITSCAFNSSGFTYQTSSPGYTVLVHAYYQWPLFVTGLGYNIANIGCGTSNSSKLLTATAAFRVEP